MPQTYDRGRSKGRAKGLPVPAMRKKEAKPLPIAAGKKQASQMVRSTVKSVRKDAAATKTRLRQGQTYKGGKGKAPGMWKENKTKATVRRRKSR